MSHSTYATFSFGGLIGPGLELDFYLVGVRPILICYFLHSLGILLAKLGFAAVIISSVSVTDKAKRDDSEP